MSPDRIATLRITVFGLTGAICLVYAIAALMTGRPDPLPMWIPAVSGVLTGVFLYALSGLAGPKVAAMAWDEGYAADAQRAAAISYWIALLLYPAFGLLLVLGIVGWSLAFSAMSLLTGAAYLLLLVRFDLRGRAAQ